MGQTHKSCESESMKVRKRTQIKPVPTCRSSLGVKANGCNGSIGRNVAAVSGDEGGLKLRSMLPTALTLESRLPATLDPEAGAKADSEGEGEAGAWAEASAAGLALVSAPRSGLPGVA